jgi:hypothetical protein
MARQTTAQRICEDCYAPETGWLLPSEIYLRAEKGTRIYEDYYSSGWHFPDGSALEVQEDGCYAS